MGLGGNKEGAVKVAAEFVSKLKAAGIETVVYDRKRVSLSWCCCSIC